MEKDIEILKPTEKGKDPEKRYLKELKLVETDKENPIQGKVSDPEDLYIFMRDLQDSAVPKILGVFLDENNLSVGNEVLGLGSAPKDFDTGSIYKYYLMLNAKGFVIIINHISGDPAPTDEDIKLIRKIQVDCQTLSFKPTCIDFIIVGNKKYWSYGIQEGIIPAFSSDDIPNNRDVL